jgi:endonuclease/exonuclease/phosphatase family metal-dependent hydrolase
MAGNTAGLRLATFNILHGRSPADDRVDIDRFAEAVKVLDADVLALQEVDRNQPRSANADLTAVAAEALGAVDQRFVAALSGMPSTWLAATGEEQPDAAAYGIALLSRRPVHGWQVVRLPPPPVSTPMWFRGSRRPELVRDEPRVAVAATVDGPRGSLTVVNTHVSFVRWWGGRQLRMVVRALDSAGPAVLMGDLNMGPRPAARLSGMRPLASGATFPASAPTEQLDHVLARGSVEEVGEASDQTVHRLPLSDHRALSVTLR